MFLLRWIALRDVNRFLAAGMKRAKDLRIQRVILSAVLLLPLSTQAATIFGTNMLANASATTEKKIVFTPWPPGPWAQGLNIISRRSVSATFSSTGAFSISLVQGLYDVAIDNQQAGSIVVPDSTDTININDVWASVLFFRTASEFGMVRQDTNDTTQGFLPQKLEAGTNIVLTASTNAGFRTLKVNATSSGSGDVTASNTLTNLMPLLGSGDETIQATNAVGFRAAVGLAIGTDVQAYDADLDDLADGTLSGSKVGTGIIGDNVTSGTVAAARIDAAMTTDVEAAAAYQPLDADLTDLADGSLTGSKVGTGISGDNITSGTVADARIDAAITRDAEAAAAYQPLDADLTDLADGTLTASKLGTGLDAANIADGTVSNAEFQRLDATSSIQAQLDGKAPIASPTFTGVATTPVLLSTKAIQSYQGALTHAGTVTLDFDASTTINQISLTGAVTFALSNLATNRTYRLRINNPQATNCTVTLPANTSTNFYGGAPTYITAGKVAIWSMEAWGTGNADVFSAWSETQ